MPWRAATGPITSDRGRCFVARLEDGAIQTACADPLFPLAIGSHSENDVVVQEGETTDLTTDYERALTILILHNFEAHTSTFEPAGVEREIENHYHYHVALRVLVFETDATTRHRIRDALVDLCFTVDVASEPDDALYFAASRHYDVVVSPAAQIKLAQKLRRDSSRSVVLTGTQTGHVEETGTQVVKPSDVAQTVAMLERTLAGKTPERIELSSLSIDTQKQAVWRGRRRIQLTRREYALLEYLAARAGQVVSVAEIASRLYLGERSPNLIAVYVGYLRRKLGAPPIIMTEQGVGYTIRS